MAISKMRHHFGRRNAAAVLLGLAALGYIAFTLVVQALPSQSAASDSPRQAIKGSAQRATNATTSVVSTGSAASAGTATTRDFDYFPDHYVNQATKVEELSPTF